MALATKIVEETKPVEFVTVECVSLPKSMTERKDADGNVHPGPGYNARGIVGVLPGQKIRIPKPDAEALVSEYPKGAKVTRKVQDNKGDWKEASFDAPIQFAVCK